MAKRIPLTIIQGTTFSYSIGIEDKNHVEYFTDNMYANSAMRKSYASSNSITFTTDVANSVLTISLTAEQTANLEAGRYVYDTNVTDTLQNTITRIIEGVVTVRPSATR